MDASRWQWSSAILRMLDGEWDADAEQRLADFFAPEVRELLPPAELSCNPILSINAQKAVLYDDAPDVSLAVEGGADLDLSPVLVEELWPLMQDRLLKQLAMQEAAVRLDWDRDTGTASYRVVPASLVTCIADPKRPSVPLAVSEYRIRRTVGGDIEEWTVETWDVRDPKNPVFRIEAIDQRGKRVDVTATYYVDDDGVPATDYPYRDTACAPVLPYELYHARVGTSLWAPKRGREVVSGTLTSAALWTMWIGGVRDGAHPQRLLIDGTVATVATPKPSGGSQVRVVRMNPMAILEVKSDGAGRASHGQWQPAMDPKTAGEAIEAFIAGLAVYADLSPSDISIGSQGKSGYAIVVSRDGLRRAQKRLVPPCLMGDRRLLAKAAKLANAYGGHALPEDPKAWRIKYADIGRTPDEVKAEREELVARRDQKLAHPVEVFMALNGLDDREEAERQMCEIALWERVHAGKVAEMATEKGVHMGATVEAEETEEVEPTPATPEPPAPAAAPTAPAPDVPAANTALNGAQVQAAQGIVAAVAAGQLPRETGVAMLQEFFNIDPARAERIMGAVGKSFRPAPPPEAAPAAK